MSEASDVMPESPTDTSSESVIAESVSVQTSLRSRWSVEHCDGAYKHKKQNVKKISLI